MTQRSRLRRSARPSILLTLAQTCSVCRPFNDSMKTLKEISYLWGKRWDVPSSFSSTFLFTSTHINALSFAFIIQSLTLVLFILLHSCSLTLSRKLVYQKGMPRAIYVEGNGFNFFFKWNTIDLQGCVNYCCRAKWFSFINMYKYIYIYTFISFLSSFLLRFIIGYWI